jgi:hypothetical protein
MPYLHLVPRKPPPSSRAAGLDKEDKDEDSHCGRFSDAFSQCPLVNCSASFRVLESGRRFYLSSRYR